MRKIEERVFVVRSQSGTWKQIALVEDGKVTWWELHRVRHPIAGWNERDEWRADWAGMSASDIVDWIRAGYDCTDGVLCESANQDEVDWVVERTEGGKVS